MEANASEHIRKILELNSAGDLLSPENQKKPSGDNAMGSDKTSKTSTGASWQDIKKYE